ncbi:hypothetical protein CDAR_395901 [Caerostris darwini]|uniref:Uncharacterized protein n=1 Tax=Caerostris darwini TaxID=1538125 RepID=A0AAV4QLV0_9ARAC|nr:hypothetical protein CDAR_395901 [Caerostris darwini]
MRLGPFQNSVGHSFDAPFTVEPSSQRKRRFAASSVAESGSLLFIAWAFYLQKGALQACNRQSGSVFDHYPIPVLKWSHVLLSRKVDSQQSALSK